MLTEKQKETIALAKAKYKKVEKVIDHSDKLALWDDIVLNPLNYDRLVIASMMEWFNIREHERIFKEMKLYLHTHDKKFRAIFEDE